MPTPAISIIIPTHNRAGSLQRLLTLLCTQSIPAGSMEVIVIADNCTDETISFLSRYKPPYTFCFTELQTGNPAIARNKGAALATAALLLFLDDDVEPASGLVEAHIKNHMLRGRVVIGYLPYTTSLPNDLFTISLRHWWEDKFDKMNEPGHLFSYEDLLSGNFSLPRVMFEEAGGFDNSLSCREDYELGLRLIAAGAQLVFAADAKGYHHDDTTRLPRSLQRKYLEAQAAIAIGRKHTYMDMTLHCNSLHYPEAILMSKRIWWMKNLSFVTHMYAGLLQQQMYLLARIKWRGRWQRLNRKLHAYWYVKGIVDELGSVKAIRQYVRELQSRQNSTNPLLINLEEGIGQAAQTVNGHCPRRVQLVYGQLAIGEMPYKPGAEHYNGTHLKKVLAKDLFCPLISQLALEGKITVNSTKDTGK